MSWYYAENNDRRGPIEDAAFDALVTQGTVRPDTLVWREGMDNWQPLSASGYVAGSVASAGSTAPSGSAVPRTSEEMGVCSESGRILPRSELVEINGRLVSAEYKNVVLQRIREGVGASGAAADPEALAQAIEQRGYDISIGTCISRGWGVMKSRFWLVVGAAFLTMLISQATGLVVPLFGPLLVFGPITAGMYWIMILIQRQEPVSIGDAFVGFTRGFGQYLGFTAVMFGAIFACFIPGGIFFGIGTTMNASSSAAGAGAGSVAMFAIGGLLFCAGFVAMIYLWTSWIFALPLITDKQIEFWPAMKLSRRIVGLHWWSIFGLILCTFLVVMGLFLGYALVVGIGGAILSALTTSKEILVSLGVLAAIFFFLLLLATMPLTYASVAVAYNEIFGRPDDRR